MATRLLVLNSPLCFLSSKFGKCPVKVLKSALADFYCDVDLSNAKQQLLNDVAKLNLSEKLPHIPLRREGDNRLVREVEDIVTVFTYLDERKQLHNLPNYVSDNPDHMPSVRLYEGDLKILMDYLTKMDDKIALLNSTMSMVIHDVRSLQSKCVPVQTLPAQPAINNTANQPQHAVSMDANKPAMIWAGGSDRPSLLAPVTSLTTLSTLSTTSTLPTKTTTSIVNANLGQHPSVNSSTSWASVVDATYRNRFSGLTDDDQSRGETETEPPFQSCETNRTRRKRRRQLSRQSQQQQQHQLTPPRSHSPVPASIVRSRRGPLIVGKAEKPSSNINVAAAHLWYKKSVFYVDNVSCSVTTDEMTEFIYNLQVRLVSCIEVKPRRRRHDMEPPAYKAFRVCINSDDRQAFLDDNKWPAYVGISDWLFKSNNSTTSTSVKKQHISDPPDAAESATTAAANTESTTAAVTTRAPGNPTDSADMDTTIIVDASTYSSSLATAATD